MRRQDEDEDVVEVVEEGEARELAGEELDAELARQLGETSAAAAIERAPEAAAAAATKKKRGRKRSDDPPLDAAMSTPPLAAPASPAPAPAVAPTESALWAVVERRREVERTIARLEATAAPPTATAEEIAWRREMIEGYVSMQRCIEERDRVVLTHVASHHRLAPRQHDVGAGMFAPLYRH